MGALHMNSGGQSLQVEADLALGQPGKCSKDRIMLAFFFIA